MQRSERLVLLGIGVILNGWFLKMILLILVVSVHFTAIQRLLFVKNKAKMREMIDENPI